MAIIEITIAQPQQTQPLDLKSRNYPAIMNYIFYRPINIF